MSNKETQEQYCKVPVSKLAHLIIAHNRQLTLDNEGVDYGDALDGHRDWLESVEAGSESETQKNIVMRAGFEVVEG